MRAARVGPLIVRPCVATGPTARGTGAAGSAALRVDSAPGVVAGVAETTLAGAWRPPSSKTGGGGAVEWDGAVLVGVTAGVTVAGVVAGVVVVTGGAVCFVARCWAAARCAAACWAAACC